jgi:parallel beta-helix repeat protein
MTQLVMYPGLANSPQTELSAAINDTDVTIPLVDASKLPAAPNIATMGTDETAETILYTGISGNDLTGVTRGVEGTAKSWSMGAKVSRNFTNRDYATLKGNIEDLDTRAVAHEAETVTQIFNVKTGFGAKGDDVTDDKNAVQAAVNAAASAGGGVVFFPSGTYIISPGIIIKSNVVLQGVIGSTIIKLSATAPANQSLLINQFTGGPVDIWTDHDMALKDIVFDGNNNVNRTVALLNFIKAKHVTISGVTIKNNSHIGLDIAGCYRVQIKDSYFTNNGRPKPSTISAPALHVYPNPGDSTKCLYVTIEDCMFEDNEWSGAYFMPQEGTIARCRFVNNGESSIYLGGAYNVSIVDNYIFGAKMSNISATGIEIGGSHIIVRGNHIYNCESSGISITDSQRVIIADNIIKNNGQTFGAAGITVISTKTSPNQPNHVKIHGNQITDDQTIKTQTYGIQFGTYSANVESVEIVDNDLSGNLTAGILMDTAWGIGCYTLNNFGNPSSNPRAGQFQAPDTLGNYIYTGIGFKPRVIMFHAIEVSTTRSVQCTSMVSPGNNSANYSASDGANATGGTVNKTIALYSPTGVLICEASFVTFDNFGFTLNFSNVTVRPLISFTALP